MYSISSNNHAVSLKQGTPKFYDLLILKELLNICSVHESFKTLILWSFFSEKWGHMSYLSLSICDFHKNET